jgi:hypothetical protein
MRLRSLRVQALVTRRVLRKTNTQADAERNGQDDEHDDEEAPPLELSAVGGVLLCLLDLLVALLDVLNGVDGVVLRGLDDGVLLLDQRGELLVQDGEIGQGLLDALELVVAGADIAQ